MNYFCAFCGKKNVLGYSRYFQTIEYLRYSFHFKKNGAKRHLQIFNLQSSILNSGLSGCWVLDTGYWMLGTWYWVLGTGYSITQIRKTIR
jgi:hypothetical protein